MKFIYSLLIITLLGFGVYQVHVEYKVREEAKKRADKALIKQSIDCLKMDESKATRADVKRCYKILDRVEWRMAFNWR
tara:strand:- start:305 stop:538 length:234 start_codon:yes stop_codon:yes gene_type:complete